MEKYLLDTNVLWDVGESDDYFARLQHQLGKARCLTVMAPMVLIELVIGLINGSEEYFERNKHVFRRIQDLNPEILELTTAFAQQLLCGADSGNNPVRPAHYWSLIHAINSSESKEEFFNIANSPDFGWAKIEQLPSIHKAELDSELAFLRVIVSQKSTKTPGEFMVDSLSVGAYKPDSQKINESFSAAFEYLQSVLTRVRSGGKPEKNDRGVYLDYNILWYLSAPDIILITNEKFCKWITTSPQRSRIIPPNW